MTERFDSGSGLQTESETPDAWLGMLREPKECDQPLGPTVKAIVVEHFARTFFGPEGNYWENTNLKQFVQPFDGVHALIKDCMHTVCSWTGIGFVVLH